MHCFVLQLYALYSAMGAQTTPKNSPGKLNTNKCGAWVAPIKYLHLKLVENSDVFEGFMFLSVIVV